MSLIAVLSAGCATFDPGANRARTEGKTIAVASKLGPSLNLLWIGTTVFNNEQGEYRLDNPRIEQTALSSAAWAISAEGRHRAVTFAEPFDPADAESRKKVADKADFLLVIQSGTAPDVVYRTNQVMRGVGVLQRSMFGLTPRAVVHAVLQGELFDVRTGESLGKTRATEFVDAPAFLETGPRIPAASLEQTLESAATRVKGAAITLVKDLGL